MGTKYTTNTLSGYNSSPPSDDGTEVDSNKVEWSKHIGKIGNPLKNQVAAIDSALVAMADLGPNSQSASYTTVAADHLKMIECINTITVTLLAVASAPSGYTVRVKNTGIGVLTVTGSASETIDGITDIYLHPNETTALQLNAAGTAYITLQHEPYFGPLLQTINYTTVLSDHLKTIECINAITVSMIPVTSVQPGYTVTIKNAGSGNVLVDGTGGDQIDGSTTPVTLLPSETDIIQLNAAGTAWISLQRIDPNLSLGSMATQDANAVSITGGTIDGVIIGGSSAVAGSFSTITGSGVLSIDDTTESTSTITGSIHTDGGLGVVKDAFFGGDISITDNKHYYAGAGDDVDIYHDGGTSYILNNTGTLVLREDVNSAQIQMFTNDSGGTSRLCLNIGGATPGVILQHGGSDVFHTVTGGTEWGTFSVGGASDGKSVSANAIIDSSRDTNSDANHFTFWNPTGLAGLIKTNTGTTTFQTTSDKTLKISHGLVDKPFDVLDGIDIHHASFKTDPNNIMMMVMAQDVDPHYPQAVSYDEDHGLWTADYGQFSPLALACIKDLNNRLKQLEQGA